jgi:peroxiredoxin
MKKLLVITLFSLFSLTSKSQMVTTKYRVIIDETAIMFDGLTGNRMSYEDFNKLRTDNVKVITIPTYGFNGKPESYKVYLNSSSQYTSRDAKTYKLGSEAPKYEFTTVKDEIIKSEDLKGKYVLINFSLPFFNPNQLKGLNTSLSKFKINSNLKTIVLMQAEKKEVQDFLKNNELNFSFIPDALPFFEYFGIVHVPDFLLIDKEGKIIGKAENFEELEALLKKI